MAKSSKKYWKGRSAQREIESQIIADKYLAQMEVKLREAQREILKEIEAFYGRYAVDNKMSIQEAKKYLTAKEMKDFKNIDLKRFREMSLSGNPEYDKLLNSISYRSQISRLEAVNAHIQIHMMELYGGRNGLQEHTNTGLAEIYQNSYHRTLYDIAKGGKDISIVELTDDRMKEVLSYNWSGKEFSNRIWDHQSGALQTIRKEMERSFVSGRSIQQTTKAIMDATGVTRSRVEALVRTEASFFNNLASHDSYNDADIDEYEILATLDLRTSNICREQDGKRYKTKDFNPGTNAPPFHVRCRSTTIPWFDESEYTDGEQRQSMDGPVDSQTYEEWYGKNVTGNQVNEAKEKMIQNRFADIEQHKKYKEVLGKNALTTFAAFQNLKYNNSKEWNLLKDYKKSRESNMISAHTSFDNYLQYKNRIDKELIGIATTDGIVIKSQSKHFIERVFGTSEDPHTKRSRNGVSLEEISSALLNGTVKVNKRANNSKKYVGDTCEVSVNPETGNLIQVNPISSRREKK